MDGGNVADRASRRKPPPLIVAVAQAPRYRGIKRLVLLQLALWGNRDGTRIFPSLGHVAELAGIDVRSVRRHVRAFETDGVLTAVARSRGGRAANGRARTTEYRLNLAALNPDSGVRVNPDSGVPQPGLWCPSTRTHESDNPVRPSKTLAPPASPAEGQAGGASETREEIEAEIEALQNDLRSYMDPDAARAVRRRLAEYKRKLTTA